MATFGSSFSNAMKLRKFHNGNILRHNRSRDGIATVQRSGRKNFSRDTETWWLLDAAGLQVHETAKIASHYITGQHRPDFNPRSHFTPDQVVVINCKDLVMVGDNWSREAVSWRTPWPSGKYRVRASSMFERDPCMLLNHYIMKELTHYTHESRNHTVATSKRDSLLEFAWLYEDALHPHGDEALRPVRWMGQKKGSTWKGEREVRWWSNPYQI